MMETRIKDYTEDELLSLFTEAGAELNILENVLNELSNKANAKRLKNVMHIKGLPWWGIILGLIAIGMSLYYFFIFNIDLSGIFNKFNWEYVQGNLDELNRPLEILTCCIAALVVIVVHLIFKAKNTKKRKVENAVFDAELLEINKKLEYIVEHQISKLPIIPETYRYSLALSTMRKYIENMVASSWSECVILYEQQLHRWKLEKNSDENLRLQKEIAFYSQNAQKNAKTASIFAGLAALTSVTTLGVAALSDR